MEKRGLRVAGAVSRKRIEMVRGLVVVVCVCGVAGMFFRSETGWCEGEGVEAAGGVNVNTASAASLERLRGIGATRAAAILAYRKRVRVSGTWPAFECAEDLEGVRGIGPKTVDKNRMYLRFEKHSE